MASYVPRAAFDDEEPIPIPSIAPVTRRTALQRMAQWEELIDIMLVDKVYGAKELAARMGMSPRTIFSWMGNEEFQVRYAERLERDLGSRAGVALGFLIRAIEDPKTPFSERIKLCKWLHDRNQRAAERLKGRARVSQPEEGLSEEQREHLDQVLARRATKQDPPDVVAAS